MRYFNKPVAVSILLVVLMLPSIARAELMYSARLCTPSAPCTVGYGPHGGTPPAGYLDGLNNSLFVSMFSYVYGVNANSVFTWYVNGSNSSGYVFGDVSGPGDVHSEFIFIAGKLLCCTLDDPFRIDDLNDNNLLVGYIPPGDGPPYSGPIIGALLADANAGERPVQYTLTPEASALLGHAYMTFVAIDDEDRILARDQFGGQLYELDPVPEPSGVLIFFLPLCLLIGLDWRWRRWKASRAG